MFKFKVTLIFSFLGFLQLSGQIDRHKIIADSIFSAVLGEHRRFSVYLPDDYSTAEKEYPIILVLDGQERAELSAVTAGFLSAMNMMPKAIVIGLDNTDRNRDLLPVKSARMGGGGAGPFLEFFQAELIPHLQSSYRTNGFRIFLGHSFGGLWTMYALLTKPAIADAFICLDPSFWFENNWIIKYASAQLLSTTVTDKLIFSAGRGERSEVRNGIAAMDSVLKASGFGPDNYQLRSYPDEHHTSLTYKGGYDALRFVYEGYYGRPLQVFPAGGYILDDPVPVYLGSFHDNIHYTTDGAIPTGNSPRFNVPHKFSFNGREKDVPAVAILAPGVLALRSINERYRSGHLLRARFERRQVSEPVNIEAGKLITGMARHTYLDNAKGGATEADFSSSDFRIVEGLDCVSLPFDQRGSIVFEGFLQIEKSGNHVFHLGADTEARFFINDTLIIDIRDNSWKSFAVFLQAGLHPVRVEYKKEKGNPFLQMDYMEPESYKIYPIPPDRFRARSNRK